MNHPDRLSNQMAAVTSCLLCNGDCLSSESYTINQIFSWWGEQGHSFSRKVLNQYRDFSRTALYTCKSCGFGIFSPMIAGTNEFYQELSSEGQGSYYSQETWEHRQALNDLQEYGSILEIGCGAGYFLERLKQRGKKVLGLELNAAAAAFARQREVSVKTTDIETIANSQQGRFEAVCLFQVIEHVAKPLEFLRHVLVCLKPGGLLILCVPNMAGILGKMDPTVSNVPPHHVTRWTPESLGLLGRHLHLTLVDLRYEPAYNFLRTYLGEWLRHHGIPEWITKQAWRLGLSLPIKFLRTLKPKGFKSLPGHTAYALFRKNEAMG
jgi:2-polyprenyl-3-methyl-5-hydroxy-6-metoxy-1,4-benzoquinol methylase